MIVEPLSKSEVHPYSPESIQKAALLLKQGDLVSFPTETVYGLGANALDTDACTRIFTTKGRPLTDPLIVHVTSLEQAETLVVMEGKIKATFEKLAKKYWPGPLTLVVKANLDVIPTLVTANTGYVGVRLPNHRCA